MTDKQRWKKIQRHVGAVADGVPGPKTAKAIEGYLFDGEAPTLPASLAGLVASIAEKEIGVREVPKDSNRGPRVEEYQAATWLDGTGWPWCAAFVCWCVHEAGKIVDLPFKRPRTAAAWDFERWANKEGLDILKGPLASNSDLRRGDILVYTFSHIGICTSSAPLRAVEGNTNLSGSREGGGVYLQSRKLKHVRSRIRLGKK